MPAKRVVVFGGAGFLGSHVSDKLSAAGHRVTVFDRRPSTHLRPDQEMIVGDIRERPLVVRALAGAEVAFNFAGLADIDDARQRPVDTIEQNVLGNAIILEGCRENGVGRIVFASSVYVYSQAGAFYRISKQACENYIEGYHEVYGLDYTILRFGTLYGPRADERNAVYRFIRQALEEGRIDYDGDREARREYIHVGDAAQACVDILAPAFANQHIVLTGPQLIRVDELLRMIGEIVPGEVAVHFGFSGRKTAHYVLTPHKFSPRIGRKYIPQMQIDLGQGLHQQVEEMHQRLHPSLHENEGIWLET